MSSQDAAHNGVEETPGVARENGPRTPGVSSTPDAARVVFVEYGTHKTIVIEGGSGCSGFLRISDQDTVDALRDAFAKAGWEIEDK